MSLTDGIIKLAIKECNKSTYKKKMSAVIFNKSRIISYAHNEIRGSSICMKYRLWDRSLHAEQAALLGLDWTKLSNCDIFVMRLNNFGEFRLAKPCQMCTGLIKYVKLKNIYFTTSDGKIEKIKVYEAADAKKKITWSGDLRKTGFGKSVVTRWREYIKLDKL